MKRRCETERNGFKSEIVKMREDLKIQEWEKKTQAAAKLREDRIKPSKRGGVEYIQPEAEKGFCESLWMRRILKIAFLNCIQRRHIKQHIRNIAVFEKAFSTIKQSTGIEHIDEIVKIFIDLENRNFSLLGYINQTHRDIENLQSQWREIEHMAADTKD